eukprot:1631382-Heterocapsa_arctica.AAC.1
MGSSKFGMVYQAFVVLLLAAAAVHMFYEAALINSVDGHSRHISRLPIVIGALLGYLALHAGRMSSLLGTTTNTL